MNLRMSVSPSQPRKYRLLSLLCVRARRVSLRHPALPLRDRVVAAIAAAVGGIDERAVGQPRPSQASTRATVLHRAVRERDGGAGLERAAGDAAREQRLRRRALEAPQRLAAVRVL